MIRRRPRCWLICCCPRRSPSYASLGTSTSSSLDVAAMRECLVHLRDASADLQPVRNRVGSNMDAWRWLMEQAVDQHDDVAVRRLLNDCGVHTLFWDRAFLRQAAENNDFEIVDVILTAYGDPVSRHDGHHTLSRTLNAMQGAAERGNVQMVKQIGIALQEKLGFSFLSDELVARTLSDASAECAEELRDFFTMEKQRQRLKASLSNVV